MLAAFVAMDQDASLVAQAMKKAFAETMPSISAKQFNGCCREEGS